MYVEGDINIKEWKRLLGHAVSVLQIRTIIDLPGTVCTRSSDQFHSVIYHIKWVLLLGHTVKQ